MKLVVSMAELDAMPITEATAWWEAAKHRQRGIITGCALAYRDRVESHGFTNFGEEQHLLFEALADYEAIKRTQIEYQQRRKEDRQLQAAANIARNLEEGRERHRKAVEEAKAAGKITDAVRIEYQRQQAERQSDRAAAIAAAHANPEPLPEFVWETRDERIVNRQLRSRGGIVHIETGNVEYRLPPDYSTTVRIPGGSRPRKRAE